MKRERDITRYFPLNWKNKMPLRREIEWDYEMADQKNWSNGDYKGFALKNKIKAFIKLFTITRKEILELYNIKL